MKKGFSLVELLTVIVIIGVVALIATPIVLNLVDSAKETSNLVSAAAYVKELNTSIYDFRIQGGLKISNGVYTINNSGNMCLDEECTETLQIEVNGEKPTGGSIKINNNSVSCAYNLVFKNYTATCNSDSQCDIVDGSAGEVETSLITYEDNDSSCTITVGDKVSIPLSVNNNTKIEKFYVIENPKDSNKVKLLAEWNLNIKGDSPSVLYPGVPVGYQDSHVRGTNQEKYGIIKFYPASSNPNNSYGYWTTGSDHHLNTNKYTACKNNCDPSYPGYPAYVYDSHSTISPFVQTYVGYINSQIDGANATGRLISLEELESLGCSMSDRVCSNAPSWVYQTAYWTGSAYGSGGVWDVLTSGNIYRRYFHSTIHCGIRPVIEINRSIIKPEI